VEQGVKSRLVTSLKEQTDDVRQDGRWKTVPSGLGRGKRNKPRNEQGVKSRLVTSLKEQMEDGRSSLRDHEDGGNGLLVPWFKPQITLPVPATSDHSLRFVLRRDFV